VLARVRSPAGQLAEDEPGPGVPVAVDLLEDRGVEGVVRQRRQPVPTVIECADPLLPPWVPRQVGVADPVIAAVQDGEQPVDELPGGRHPGVGAGSSAEQPRSLRGAQGEPAGEHPNRHGIRGGGHHRRGSTVHDKLFQAASGRGETAPHLGRE